MNTVGTSNRVIPWVGIIISLIGIFISCIALWFTWTNNRASLSLQEAQVVIEDVFISPSKDQKECKDVSGREFCNIITQPKIKNGGNSSARNVALEFWICTIGMNDENGRGCQEQYHMRDTELISELPPNAYTRYDEDFLSTLKYTDMRDEDIEQVQGKPRVLIFLLQYMDTLNGGTKQALYIYGNEIGKSTSWSITLSEYKKLYPYLKEEVEKYDSESAFSLYLQENPPK